MTPTLIGRWQTRVVLLWTVGLAATFVYMHRFGAFDAAVSDPARWKLPMLLGYVTLLGLTWDCLYTHLQSYRWDRDWPLAYQLLAGLPEGALVFALFRTDLLPGVQYGAQEWQQFAFHYGTVWLATYLCLLGPMRVVSPSWRFAGAEIVRPFRSKANSAYFSESPAADPEEVAKLTENEVPKAVATTVKEHHRVVA